MIASPRLDFPVTNSRPPRLSPGSEGSALRRATRFPGAVFGTRGNRSPFPPDDREPRLRPALREFHLGELRIDFDLDRLDGFDLPAVGEGVVQFLARHAPGPLRPQLLV